MQSRMPSVVRLFFYPIPQRHAGNRTCSFILLLTIPTHPPNSVYNCWRYLRMILTKSIRNLLLGITAIGLIAPTLFGQDTTKTQTVYQPLSQEEFQKVIQSTDQNDWMKIEALTDDQVKAIMNSKVMVFRMGAVQEEWQGLYLDGLKTITDDQAKLIAKNEVNLSLNGLTSLTDEQAKSLSTFKGKFVPRAFQGDPNYQRIFGTRCGGMLSLSGITALSDEQAKWLGKSKSFELDLNSLTTLNDLQAKYLGFYSGRYLQLNGIKSLTEKQIKSLAQFQGQIAFASLDKASKELFEKHGGALLGKK